MRVELRLSAQTLALLRSFANPGADFRSQARPDGPGWYTVPVSEDVSDQLEARRFDGETDDQLVARVASRPQ